MRLGQPDLFFGAYPEEKHTPIFMTGGSGYTLKQGTHGREALIFPEGLEVFLNPYTQRLDQTLALLYQRKATGME